MEIKNITGLVFIISFVLSVLFEHIAILNDFPYKPTLGLIYCRCHMQFLFEKAGHLFAYASSFLVDLHIEELFKIAFTLIKEMAGILLSGGYFFLGYYDEIRMYYTNCDFLIYWGSLIILSSVVGTIGKYFALDRKILGTFDTINTLNQKNIPEYECPIKTGKTKLFVNGR